MLERIISENLERKEGRMKEKEGTELLQPKQDVLLLTSSFCFQPSSFPSKRPSSQWNWKRANRESRRLLEPPQYDSIFLRILSMRRRALRFAASIFRFRRTLGFS